jgi:uncharacterized protein YcfJ
MNKRWMIVPLLFALASAPLQAGPHHRGFPDRAKVLAVTPIMERIEVPVEREACWQEEVEIRRHDNAGMVVGGILGGVIGHQVGRGDSRRVATVAGSIIGAAIGHDADHRGGGDARYETRHHCRVETNYVTEERLIAYRVDYRYHGRTYTTEMDRHPGRFLPVRVQVTPVD